MKRLITSLAAILLSAATYAQVTITYQVDITPFLNDGNTLATAGIRIGGDFTDLGAAVPNWNPDAAESAMTNVGGNVWSISIEYPASSVGQTQMFKFVNGTWGSNEGVESTAISDDGCGETDPDGNVNRTFVIPSEDETVCFEWDLCVSCATGSIANNAIESLNAYPNPANEMINFQVGLNGVNSASLVITDLSGRVVETATIQAGAELNLNVANYACGTYLYTVVAGESVLTGKFNKQ